MRFKFEEIINVIKSNINKDKVSIEAKQMTIREGMTRETDKNIIIRQTNEHTICPRSSYPFYIVTYYTK